MKTSPASLRSERGSLLIVAMILSAVIAISITSYVQLGRTAGTISNRAFYNNAAMNVAEAGIEQAMWAINRMIADSKDLAPGNYKVSPAFDNWTQAGSVATRTFKGFSFGQNATGYVNVHVKLLNAGGNLEPEVTAKAIVSPFRGAPIEKWVRVELQRTSVFANGLVAKEQIRFSGTNATVDSWNSGWHPDPSLSKNILYSDATKNASGTVGSIAVYADAVLGQNADIFGYVATGGIQPTVGANGLIGAFDTPPNTIAKGRISTDFTANFDPVAQPTGGTVTGAITSPRTLTAGTYSVSLIDLAGGPGTNLVIEGDVVLHMIGPSPLGTIKTTGNGGIVIKPGGSLKIYTAHEVDVAGNGVMNGGTTAATAQQPATFQIWGTSTTSQKIDIAGNGVLSGVVYAPNAAVKINGNGDVFGSVVANKIDLTGNAKFHYDESLANFGGDNPFRLKAWNELTGATERATYKSLVDF